MKEWSKKNEFNSFNSWKGLLYAPWYQSTVDWKDHKIKAPIAPVEASLDPIHACNLQCEHCNAASYLLNDLKGRKMSDEHLINLVQFLGEWGVKAICFGGGGEPTMHPALEMAISETTRCGMQSSIATNGTLLSKNLMTTLALHCRWVGISVDSASKKTYKVGRKKDCFDKVIRNIEQLVKLNKKVKASCEVSYKFLIFGYNQHEIYKACKLAKELGVRDFHARPADFSHQGMVNKKNVNPYEIDSVLEQFEKCRKLEDENFRVFTIVHKFDDTFTPRKDFEQCYASPCCIQICADGNVYLCPDSRHLEMYKLGSHYPDPKQILEFWGGEKHYDLVFSTGKKNCNTRCTFSPYCKQCQELFIKTNDPMCKFFI
jgi:MoaA/NifB/PqqE/SkfB family radical SAM enzyme